MLFISGADIIMQLDDVVHTLTTGPRLEEAMLRLLNYHLVLFFTSQSLLHGNNVCCLMCRCF